jgi:predicted CopG family antitoxin
MATAKKRVNLTIEDELYDDFEAVKEMRNETSLSSVILELAKEALEINEDLYFAKIANARLKEKRVSHAKVWSTKNKAK